jgi:DNA-binding CsgD family transcriptional regulator
VLSASETQAGLPELLSPREREVLELASRGLTNAQVAELLSVTIHAVKFHLGSIYRKLDVANRTEAAVVYLNRAGSKPTRLWQGDA